MCVTSIITLCIIILLLRVYVYILCVYSVLSINTLYMYITVWSIRLLLFTIFIMCIAALSISACFTLYFVSIKGTKRFSNRETGEEAQTERVLEGDPPCAER